jgi:single-stranded DNA-binding protein
MGDTNVVGGIVKILEIPKYINFNKNIPVTRFRVQFPQIRNTSIVYLTFWGNLANDVTNFYKINDYILIEGYISLRNRNKRFSDRSLSKYKKVEITVLKIYPIFLHLDDSPIQT